MKEKLQENWNELTVTLDSSVEDFRKALDGYKSAGVRARAGLRELKKIAHSLVKELIEYEKANK